MAKIDLIPKADFPFARQMLTFKENIAGHAADLGVTPAQMAVQAADADYFNYALVCHRTMSNHSKGWASVKKNIRSGKSLGEAVVNSAPVFADPVPPVVPGVEKRFRALVRQVKASPNYDPGIGELLGIEASSRGKPDFLTLKPKFSLIVSGNRVHVLWTWQGHRAFLDQCEIQVDRGDGKGFALVAQSTVPGYIDPAPMPDTPARWQYRVLYRANDAPAGQYSDIVSITVPPW